MPNPRQRPEPGEESKERGRHGRPEGQPFALTHERAVREPVPEQERSGGRVSYPYARLDLPRAREQAGEVDAGVPVDSGFEVLSIKPRDRVVWIAGVGQDELWGRARRAPVIDRHAILPVPPAEAEWRRNREIRIPRTP